MGRQDIPLGVLRLSAPITFGLERVAPHMSSLMRKHECLLVDLRLEDRLIDLNLDGIDVAIRVGAPLPTSNDIVAHALVDVTRILVASPAYLRRRGAIKTPEALGQHDALSNWPGTDHETFTLFGEDREARVRLNTRFRCNSLHVIRGLAVEGNGVAMVADWLVRKELRNKSLVRVLPGWNGPTAAAFAIHRTGLRGAPRVRALVDHLRAAYARDLS